MKFVYALALMLCASTSFGADALAQLNARRVRAGLPAFKPDAALQAAAERCAQQQARSGAMYHCLHIGSRSGVGMGSGSDWEGRRFNTCYAFDYSGGYAGAAAVVGRNGQTYYALDIRNSPSPVVRTVAKPVVKAPVTEAPATPAPVAQEKKPTVVKPTSAK